MHLLSPEEIKSSRAESEKEITSRLVKLAQEEALKTSELNILKSRSEQEKEQIKIEMEKFTAEMSARRNELKREVESLESRKKEALKPIESLQKEAESLLAFANSEIERIKTKEKLLDEKSEKVTEELGRIKDLEQILEERGEEAEKREEQVAAEEKRSRKSLVAVSEEWAKYHLSVNAFNKKVQDTEKSLKEQERANLTIKQALDSRSAEQYERERALKDGYESLERAKKEIMDKK